MKIRLVCGFWFVVRGLFEKTQKKELKIDISVPLTI